MKKIMLVLVMVVLVSGCVGQEPDNSGEKVTIYKSATCGCCMGHASFLGERGFDVETIASSDLDSIKTANNIPMDMRSCHTAFIGDYFVEGHMPIEAIEKLIEEKPDIDGITLPGMPSGSPGMPGTKTEEWVIYGLKDGKSFEFMRV